MTSKKNTITLNGKVYDAITGAIISSGSKPASTAISEPVVAQIPRQTAKPHAVIAAKKVHHSQTKAKTLRRDMVKNPARLTKPKKVQSDLLSGNAVSAQVVRHTQRVANERLERAQAAPKSSLVSHFGTNHSHVVVKKHHPVTVAKSPNTPHHKPAHVSRQPEISDKDILIDAALLKSLSHEQPRHHLSKRRHRVAHKLGLSPRFVSISAALVAIIAVAGFYTYQSIPRFAVAVAASRSGVQASLPAFHPNGFALDGPVTYSPGTVSLSYKARDQRTYRITQTTSDLNSKSLSNVLGDSTQQPLIAHQAAGRTVYITADGSKASWVDGGIRYSIEANSVLSTEQILSIATSL